MNVHRENQYPRTFRELEPETRARELASLQIELDKPEPMTHHRLSQWASESTDRSALVRGGVWCGIHWSKSLGRPQTPSITGGFIVTCEFKRIEFVDLGGGNYGDISRYILQPAPSVWDATKTGDEYRVGIFFFAGGGLINPNRLTVKLAPVAWEHVAHIRVGYRQLSPLGYAPFGSSGEVIVIPDYEVRHVAYSHASYVQTLGPSLEPM